MLKVIDPDKLRQVYSGGMARMDPRPLKVMHLDGKVLWNADPAPLASRRTWLWPKPLDGGYPARTVKA